MSKELLMVVEAVANEKGVAREVIFDAMEAALASAAKKRYPDQEISARVEIDRQTGNYTTFRRWEVVADDVVMESPDHQIRLMDVVDDKPDAQVGDFVEEQIENAEFGRIAAQAAKQVIVQRVREAERARLSEQIVTAEQDERRQQTHHRNISGRPVSDRPCSKRGISANSTRESPPSRTSTSRSGGARSSACSTPTVYSWRARRRPSPARVTTPWRRRGCSTSSVPSGRCTR